MSESLVKIEPLSFATVESNRYDEALNKNIAYNISGVIALFITMAAVVPIAMISCPSILAFLLSLSGTGFLTFFTTLKLVKRKEMKVLANPITQLHGRLRNSVLWFNNRVAMYNQYLLESNMDDTLDTTKLKSMHEELMDIRKGLKAKIQALAPQQLPQAPCIAPLLDSLSRLQEHECILPASDRIRLLSQGEADASMAEVEELLK